MRKEALVEAVAKKRRKDLDWAHCGRGGAVETGARGKNEGKRHRGRPMLGMIDDLKEGSYESMKRRAEDRERWRVWLPRTCREAENS